MSDWYTDTNACNFLSPVYQELDMEDEKGITTGTYYWDSNSRTSNYGKEMCCHGADILHWNLWKLKPEC